MVKWDSFFFLLLGSSFLFFPFLLDSHLQHRVSITSFHSTSHWHYPAAYPIKPLNDSARCEEQGGPSHGVPEEASGVKLRFLFESDRHDLGACGLGLSDVSIDVAPSAYGSVRDCLRLAQSIPSSRFCQPVVFHAFWGSLPVREQASLFIVSFLTTQDLDYVTLWVWSPTGVNAKLDPHFKPFLSSPHLIFKEFNAQVEAVGTILASFPDIISIGTTANDPRFYLYGDLFRNLVLAKYGGVYADMDTLFLRNLGPLLGQEFALQWGRSCGESNGAVLRMIAGSNFSKNLLTFVSQTDPRKITHGGAPYAWGKMALFDSRNYFQRLPGCFFDRRWFGTEAGAYGAFADHIHGGIFGKEREGDSDYQILRKELTHTLRKRDPLLHAALKRAGFNVN